MRVTVKRQESEQGLARVCQRTRGWDIRVNKMLFAQVRPLYKGGRHRGASTAHERPSLMAQQPQTKCDPDLYANGQTVCVLAGTSTAIEAIVVRVRELLDVPLDWHYLGGRANVLTLAVPEMHDKIRDEIRMAMPVWLSPETRSGGEGTR